MKVFVQKKESVGARPSYYEYKTFKTGQESVLHTLAL